MTLLRVLCSLERQLMLFEHAKYIAVQNPVRCERHCYLLPE